MFETLTKRLTGSFSFLRGRQELTEENVSEGLTQVRQALLEADGSQTTWSGNPAWAVLRNPFISAGD